MKRILFILFVCVPLMVAAQMVEPVKWSGEEMGDSVRLTGRLQSREYQKLLDSGETLTRSAYEVSAFTLEAAEAEGTEVDIVAYPVGEVDQHLDGVDCALLGPQVGYMKAQMQAKAKAAGVPCDVIPMADYGMVNGKNVLAFAKKLIGC